jgi:hypothetical protein
VKPVWLCDAATQLDVSIETLIDRILAEELEAFGIEDGVDLPDSIPPAHFLVPLRERTKMTPEERNELITLGHEIPVDYTGPFEWADPDYDERNGPALRSVCPSTCLDIEECTIFADGEPRWTDIVVMLPDSESGKADTTKKSASLDTYANYQRETKEKTGNWSSNADDRKWAKQNGYGRDSVRDVRARFKATLSDADRDVFEAVGRRAGKKAVLRN